MIDFSQLCVLGFMGIGNMELLVVAGVILILFGHRLPSVMRSLGSGITEFKKGVAGVGDEDDAAALEKKKEVS